MGIRDDIKRRITDFKDLCVNHQVKSLYVFGSSITEKFDPIKSDIDLLVEIENPDPLERGEKLLDLWDKFESFSCFPQFFKIGSERLDFIEVLFENGCCRAIFGYVYPAT